MRRLSFWLKAALALALVAAGDLLLWEEAGFGLNLALLSLGLVAAVVAANPGVRRGGTARAAIVVATAFAALQIERPTLIGWLLFAIAIGVAALAPRAAEGDDAWRWGQRLVAAALKAAVGPVFDLRGLLRARVRSRPLKLLTMLAAVVLPVCGGAVFLWLFAAANPVIALTLTSLGTPQLDVGRAVFWGVLALPAWAALRPRGLRRTFRTPGIEGDLELAWAGPGSIAASLALFNLLFALQNGLDVAYLWSGAGLPGGMTFADYAHRGAYPLIATALLAALFVLVFLRPGSKTAAVPAIRWLVIAWVAQNLFLVASTALRTLDYIEAYALTRMRIAALLWMGVVAVGLVLVLWRLLAARSSSWLINANMLAAGLALTICSVVDLGAVAAAWNVRHAREVGGTGVGLDLCYMRDLNGAAVVSLAELERKPLAPDFRDRVVLARRQLTARMARDQAAWRTWRWRDARRLAAVQALTHEPFQTSLPDPGRCDSD